MFPLRVNTFCFYFSLKTGALLVCFLDGILSLISFVVWVSIGFVLLSRRRHHQQDGSSAFPYIHFALGLGTIVTQIAMGLILYMGLQEENPRHFKTYLILGATTTTFQLCSIGLTVHFAEVAFVYGMIISIPVHLYFMVVVYSALREMQNEQKKFFCAALHYQMNQEQTEENVV